jgi:hypothetical protein
MKIEMIDKSNTKNKSNAEVVVSGDDINTCEIEWNNTNT